MASKSEQGSQAARAEEAENLKKQKASKPRKKKGRTILIIVAAVVVVVLAAAYILFSHFYGLMNHKAITVSPDYTQPEETSEDWSTVDASTLTDDQLKKLQNDLAANIQENAEQPEYDGDVYNILLMGTDIRVSGDSARTDSMILVSINKNTKKIVLTSFLRDIYLYIPDYGYQRLNVANEVGGPDRTLETIEQNFGIKVDKYAQVNFYVFIDIVDALGGVDVTLTDDEIEEMNLKMQEVNSYMYDHDNAHLYDNNISGGAGDYHLDGAQALAYCRVRYVDSDFGRTGRQREVLQQLWTKIKSMSLITVYQLMDKTFPNVTSNLSKSECLGLLGTLTQVMNYDVETVQVPGDGMYTNASIDGMSVLQIDMAKNKTAINDAIYGD